MSMPGVETSESESRERLTAILRATAPLLRPFAGGLPTSSAIDGETHSCLVPLPIKTPVGRRSVPDAAQPSSSRRRWAR
jgi:hypothetical protein